MGTLSVSTTSGTREGFTIMAGQGNSWNDFMQSKPVRVMLNAFCATICGYYAVGPCLTS